jgi:hypothetical protein
MLLMIMRDVGDAAERFRRRALECRQLAANARDAYWRDKLMEIADQLDQEAEVVEAEEARDRGRLN